MRDHSERTFRKDIAQLQNVFRFVLERVQSLGIGEPHRSWADLVVEELFTNMVKYSSGPKDVAIRIDRDGDDLRVRLTDFDVEAFDVTKEAPRVDVERPIGEREPGGLGLHLVRETSDSVHYEHENGNSVITVTKTLRP